jgi:hypothetical protein
MSEPDPEANKSEINSNWTLATEAFGIVLVCEGKSKSRKVWKTVGVVTDSFNIFGGEVEYIAIVVDNQAFWLNHANLTKRRSKTWPLEKPIHKLNDICALHVAVITLVHF